MSEATGPAATKVHATTDVFVWILAAVPLIASIVAAFLDQNVDVDPNALLAAAIILQMVSCAVLADMDAIRLVRAGRTQPSLGSRLLPPVYLWRRSAKFFATFLCFLMVGIAGALPSVNRGFLTGFGVPACNSFFADYAMKGALDAVLETSFDRTTRKCYGEINGRAYRYAFELAGGGLRTTMAGAGK